MSFLMWPLLIGLVGISIPVIIHLLHRQRTEPVLWGAMQFLRVSALQMKRKKKVENWLLMAVRILALAALALALARPRVARSTFFPAGLAQAPVDVAVVLDHSLSTGRASNGQTVFDREIAVSDQVLDQLRPNSTLSVILAEHRPRPLNAQPIKKSDRGTIEQLRRQLRQEKQGMTDCSIPDAISAARQVLGRGRNPDKLILVVSDRQRSNWHIKDDALWRAAEGSRSKEVARNLAVHELSIKPDTEFANVSVADITVQPTILGAGRPAQINATVSNTGTKPMSGLSARLMVNGKELGTRPVGALAPKASSTVRFDIDQLTRPGSSWMQVSVNAVDALQADNQAVAALNVLQKLPLLIIDGQLSSAASFQASRFLQAAVQPQDSSLIKAKVVSIADALGTKFDDFTVVVVNDVPSLPRVLRERLSDYGRSGHGIWFILGPRTQRVLLDRDLPAAEFFRLQAADVKSAGRTPGGVEVKDPVNPMVSVVIGNERNALTGAATRNWWAIKPADSDAHTVLAAGSGDPFVIERPYGTNGGLVALWTTGADGSWNNWNLMPNFVPLVNETIYHLAAPQMRGLENHGIQAGEPIEWAGPAKPAVQSVTITLPDNSRVQRPATFNNGRWIVTYPDTYLPGIYRLEFAPTEIQPVYYGVNINRDELDPTALDASDVDWLKRGGYLDPAHPTITEADLPAVVRRDSSARELWGWIGGILLASLLVETFMTYRLIGAQKRIDVAGAGLTTAHA